MDNEIIKLNDVSFAYGNNLVLKNINLTVYKNDFIGIIGKNGTGKSTLLKIILSQLKPQSGKVITKNLKIGYVEQVTHSNDLSFPASVYEIVMLGLYEKIGRYKLPNKKNKQMVLNTLKIVGLAGLENKMFSHLSGGQQQRVLIAKALVSNPELLILDEPTNSVDASSEEEFFELIKHLNKAHNKTIIIVTHNIKKLKDATKIYTLENCTLKEENNA